MKIWKFISLSCWVYREVETFERLDYRWFPTLETVEIAQTPGEVELQMKALYRAWLTWIIKYDSYLQGLRTKFFQSYSYIFKKKKKEMNKGSYPRNLTFVWPTLKMKTIYVLPCLWWWAWNHILRKIMPTKKTAHNKKPQNWNLCFHHAFIF